MDGVINDLGALGGTARPWRTDVIVSDPGSARIGLHLQQDDGTLSPRRRFPALAEVTVAGLREEAFLILPHETVRTYYARKGQDIDRWLAGMRRLQTRFGEDGGGLG